MKRRTTKTEKFSLLVGLAAMMFSIVVSLVLRNGGFDLTSATQIFLLILPVVAIVITYLLMRFVLKNKNGD